MVVNPTSALPVVVTPTEVETPVIVRVDAGSTVIGVSTVVEVLPEPVTVPVTILTTPDPVNVATVPTPDAVLFVVVLVDNPP